MGARRLALVALVCVVAACGQSRVPSPQASPAPPGSAIPTPAATTLPTADLIVATPLPTPFVQNRLPSSFTYLVRWQNTSSYAAVFTPSVEVSATGTYTLDVPSRVFLFPGERQDWALGGALVQEATTITSVVAHATNVEWLQRSDGNAAYQELGYGSFDQDCAWILGRPWTGCTWTNPNPYPVAVAAAALAMACPSGTSTAGCVMLGRYPSTGGDATILLPAAGSSFVGTPDRLWGLLSACLNQTETGCTIPASSRLTFSLQPNVDVMLDQPGWTPLR